jgi:hypothetical protein
MDPVKVVIAGTFLAAATVGTMIATFMTPPKQAYPIYFGVGAVSLFVAYKFVTGNY